MRSRARSKANPASKTARRCLYYNLAPNEMLASPDLMEREFWSVAETEGITDIEELNKIPVEDDLDEVTRLVDRLFVHLQRRT